MRWWIEFHHLRLEMEKIFLCSPTLKKKMKNLYATFLGGIHEKMIHS